MLINRQPLDFCLLGGRSINNKSIQIKEYVGDQNIDIFALTETWLTPINQTSLPVISAHADMHPHIETDHFLNNRRSKGLVILFVKFVHNS